MEANSGKSVKFRSVAERRVSTLIKNVRRLGDLANPRLYEYTPEQVAQMFGALGEELAAAQDKFAQPPPQRKPPPNFIFE